VSEFVERGVEWDMSIDLRSSHNSRSRVAELSDLRFVYEQARRYVMARPWERLAGASLYLDLKVGSWLEVCAQHLTNGQNNVVFVFPGHRNMLDFQRAGLSEPPAGTIFIELIDDQSVTPADAGISDYGWPTALRPIPAFQTITPYGWSPLERGQLRLLALAFAAITQFDAAADDARNPEIDGQLTMPGEARGRYRARRAPGDKDSHIPLMGIPRNDLYGDSDGSLSFSLVPWAEYSALLSEARLVRPAVHAFDDGADIPLVEISGAANETATIAQKVKAADPLGVAFSDTPHGSHAAILIGLKDTYMLVDTEDGQEELALWRHNVESSGGAYAIVVRDGQVESNGDTVHAIFECRTGGS